jgi:hypothetical protein
MAGRRLKRLPLDDRGQAGALLDQDGIPPYKALEILRQLCRRRPAEREAIFALARSTDTHFRNIALTRAAALRPPVDPGVVRLREATVAIERAAKYTRVAHRRAEIEALLPLVERVIANVKQDQPT